MSPVDAPFRPCPCGSGRLLAMCCGTALVGTPAPDPEALMRSRYTAFVLGETAYLSATWHSSTRPARIDADSETVWTALEVLRVSSDAEQGSVEFKAHYLEGGRPGILHETSRFVREAGQWFYLDGNIHPATAAKPGRNGPCPCGSGRKYKRCCGS